MFVFDDLAKIGDKDMQKVLAEIDKADLASTIRTDIASWHKALKTSDSARRPEENTWSVLEYGCHVRDVHRVFAGRVQQMLEEDNPQFANWDQDVTAIEERYGQQDPVEVAQELADAAEAVAQKYEAVSGERWQRPGRRSNGSEFTIETLGKYHLHDVLHHTYDISEQ